MRVCEVKVIQSSAKPMIGSGDERIQMQRLHSGIKDTSSPPVPLRENISAISGDHDNHNDPIMFNNFVRQ